MRERVVEELERQTFVAAQHVVEQARMTPYRGRKRRIILARRGEQRNERAQHRRRPQRRAGERSQHTAHAIALQSRGRLFERDAIGRNGGEAFEQRNERTTQNRILEIIGADAETGDAELDEQPVEDVANRKPHRRQRIANRSILDADGIGEEEPQRKQVRHQPAPAHGVKQSYDVIEPRLIEPHAEREPRLTARFSHRLKRNAIRTVESIEVVATAPSIGQSRRHGIVGTRSRFILSGRRVRYRLPHAARDIGARRLLHHKLRRNRARFDMITRPGRSRRERVPFADRDGDGHDRAVVAVRAESR